MNRSDRDGKGEQFYSLSVAGSDLLARAMPLHYRTAIPVTAVLAAAEARQPGVVWTEACVCAPVCLLP